MARPKKVRLLPNHKILPYGESDVILYPTLEQLETLASKIKIVNRYKGITAKWIPSPEQKNMWELQAKLIKAEDGTKRPAHSHIFFLKSRQIGASTGTDLVDLAFAILNDNHGNPIVCTICLDTHQKSMGQLVKVANFAEQLEAEYELNKQQATITFPGGSIIQAVSAQSDRPGASTTSHRLHLSETPHFKKPSDVFSALLNILVPGGQVVIETTMTAERFSRNLWEDKNEYLKVFYSFESHGPFRMKYDPEILTPDIEATLEKEGFTDREAMTRWAHILANAHGGDWEKTWREFPQIPSHSWRFSQELWIRGQNYQVTVPLHAIQFIDRRGTWDVEIYQDVKANGRYVIGVDVAAGSGGDDSVVVVLNRETQEICALFAQNDILGDSLLGLIGFVQSIYTTTSHWRKNPPPVVIEKNGIGLILAQDAQELYSNIQPVTTTKGSKHRGLLATKRAIEDKIIYGPEKLQIEIEELALVKGEFINKKDVCMSIGFCLIYIDDNILPRQPIEEVGEIFKPNRNKLRKRFHSGRF